MEKREIKLRAWLKELDEMVLPQKIVAPIIKVDIGKWKTEHIMCFRYWVNDAKITYTDIPISDVILMQYTGLKDKNGKEIYEGDILFAREPYNEIDSKKVIVNWHKSGGWVVEWDGMFNGGECDLTLLGWAEDQDFSFEVIGNIYEKPEQEI